MVDLRYFVKVTHKPTGISAECNIHRSQHMNRKAAMQVLKARIWAKANLDPNTGKIHSSYILPDGIIDPKDIMEFKKQKI